MGVSNSGFYKATKHFVERSNERFGIQKDAGSAVKFFRQHANQLNYAGVTSSQNGGKCEMWTNDDFVFILNPASHDIITVYGSDFLYQENKKGKAESIGLKESSVEAIERSIDQEIYNGYLDFANANEENISRAFDIMKTLKNTRRRDYRERQIVELQKLLTDVVGELEITNTSKDKLEGVKHALTQK